MKKLVIIGGVAAGATAAARARRLNSEIEIDLFEAGDDVSFANCGLPYYLGGEVKNRSDLILASPETFKEQYDVHVHTGTEIVAIDRTKKQLTALTKKNNKQKTYSYDKLILAQGGKPIVPPLPGVDQENVFQLWTLEDMDKINTYIKKHNPKTAIVVGGGFIGLEMVEALVHRGLEVNLVEMAPQIMPNLEAEMAGFLTKELLDHGVKLHLGKALGSIQGETATLNDGTELSADLILLSVGVRPTLQLAKDSGLDIGEAGGLLVNELLQTNDSDIYAAGDMIEVTHKILNKKMRIPLAGPANRQGRIVAENVLGGKKPYKGGTGTSIVKLFDAHAGSTGLSVKQAVDAGFDADAVVVHKMSHTAYYPGAHRVSLMLVYEKTTGKILGAHAAGRVGVDKRIDVISTAIAGGLHLHDLEELDFAYAPPFNSPNGPVHMAAFTGENKRKGLYPSILASELEAFVAQEKPVIIDLRDPISFRKANLKGSINMSQNDLRSKMKKYKKQDAILLISDCGQKSHVSSRMLLGAGFEKVVNLSGGYISLERLARVKPFQTLSVGLFEIEEKKIEKGGATSSEGHAGQGAVTGSEGSVEQLPVDPASSNEPIIIDVRTIGEFQMGAVPGAICIPLDELPDNAERLIGNKNRKVVLYCASGARSAYGARILKKMGFTDIENGGGLHNMMNRV